MDKDDEYKEAQLQQELADLQAKKDELGSGSVGVQPYAENSQNQPVKIFEGVIWHPLGKTCEIEGCDKEAYTTCEYKRSGCGCCPWQGCGKAVCV